MITYLHRIGDGELGSPLCVHLILAKVLAIQQSQGEVDHAGCARARIAQQQMNAQNLLGGPLERDRPAMVAKAEVFGCCVAVKVASYRFGYNECEDASLTSIIELAEPV